VATESEKFLLSQFEFVIPEVKSFVNDDIKFSFVGEGKVELRQKVWMPIPAKFTVKGEGSVDHNLLVKKAEGYTT